MAAAFRGPADRTTRSEWRLRDGGNVPSLSGAQQPPNRISLEIRAQQFESWSPCFEGDWNRRFLSLTRSVSLRIESQPQTTSPRLPRQRLPGRIDSFLVDGRAFSSAELDKCNSAA